MSCSVLQCVAVCCSAIQSVAEYVSWSLFCPDSLDLPCVLLQCVAVCCCVLQCVAVCWSELQ